MVKGRDKKGRMFLIDGNNDPENPSGIIPMEGGGIFKMRPREVWSNWLLCATLTYAYGQEFVFQETEDGDGIILNTVTKKWFPAEHVSAMEYGKGEKIPTGNDRVFWALDKKNQKEIKNPGYSNGKVLVIFMDGAEKWTPNQVGRDIHGKHKFKHIYCVALISVHGDGACSYSVVSFEQKNSPCFEVYLNKDFTAWSVTQVQ